MRKGGELANEEKILRDSQRKVAERMIQFEIYSILKHMKHLETGYEMALKSNEDKIDPEFWGKFFLPRFSNSQYILDEVVTLYATSLDGEFTNEIKAISKSLNRFTSICEPKNDDNIFAMRRSLILLACHIKSGWDTFIFNEIEAVRKNTMI